MDQALNARLQPGFVFGKILLPSGSSGRWKPAISHCDLHSAMTLSRLPTNRTSSLGPDPVRNRSLNSASTRSWLANAEGGMRLVEDFAELLFDLGGGALQMRRQPGVDPFADPQQPLAERGEVGAASLLFDDERLPHPLRPHRDQSPGLPVGQADFRRGERQLSGALDRFQQPEKIGVDRLSRLVASGPDEVEVQCRSYV